MTGSTGSPTPAEVYQRTFVPAIFEPLSAVVLPRARLRPGGSVLDLACGTGIIARAAVGMVGDSGRVTGVDLRPGMLAVAASLPAAGPIEWRVGDAMALELPDASMDVVICQQGFQFFDDRAAAAREVRRLLRPGGRFVGAIWRSVEHQPLMAGLTEIERRYLGPLGLTEDDLVVPFSFGDREDITALFEEAGLRDVAIEEARIQTSFAAGSFVHEVEHGYAGIVPAFLDDPAAHGVFVEAVARDAEGLLARFREGDRLRAPMSTYIVTARAS